MPESVGFEGVLHGDAVTFTSAPDRSVFSFIYDNFVVQWLPNDSTQASIAVDSIDVSLLSAPVPGDGCGVASD
ncbi:MAG TPA: hypothetical protein VEA60_13940 [Allosphingosinicella sp.]|nr:hypothetical protein [Allosphingosinicella sp.]